MRALVLALAPALSLASCATPSTFVGPRCATVEGAAPIDGTNAAHLEPGLPLGWHNLRVVYPDGHLEEVKAQNTRLDGGALVAGGFLAAAGGAVLAGAYLDDVPDNVATSLPTVAALGSGAAYFLLFQWRPAPEALTTSNRCDEHGSTKP